MKNAGLFRITVMLLVISGSPAFAQLPGSVTLTVGLENVVEYQEDCVPSQYATTPGITTVTNPPYNFLSVTIIGDIRTINGAPVKGTYIGRTRALGASPSPSPGLAIADITRTAMREHIFEIQQTDGTPVGTIMSFGFSGGPAPPGAPSTDRGNWVIVGGTGAWFGAGGEVGGVSGGAVRTASMSEDPANRRVNGGGPMSFKLHIIPSQISVPRIVATANGPAVVHSADFSPVTSSTPAAPNEILSAIVTGLGPTTPSTAAGQPFPSNPPVPVSSPITVTVNGEAAEVFAAVGQPGAQNQYQVNFRLPAGTVASTAGVATVLVSAAWIPGAPFDIFVRPQS